MEKKEKKPLPVLLEILKFGIFIMGFVVFLLLGILAVHELGHSLAARIFGCSHETTFGIGKAVTHVQCDDVANVTMITLGGLILSIAMSVVMYFAGNDFIRRVSFLLFAFSILVAFDDFGALGMPYYFAVLTVFIASFIIGYGILLIVKEYHSEYVAELPGRRKALNA